MTKTWRSLRPISRWQVRRHTPGAVGGDVADAFTLALALERLGRDEEAERWYRQVAATGADGACNLALLLARTDRVPEAMMYFEIAAEQDDDSDVRRWLARHPRDGQPR